MAGWEVKLAGPAVRHLERLPEKYAHAVVRLFGALSENPRPVGKPLQYGYEGTWCARRGPYRVVYEIDEVEARVTIIKIAHRADIYRRL